MRGRFAVIRRWRTRRAARNALVAVAVGVVLSAATTVASVAWIRGGAEGHIFIEADVPDVPVALVLGTKVEADGTPSPFALCRHLGIEANGVGDDTARRYAQWWRASSTREYGACVKAAMDVLSGRYPVHLGHRETGVDDALRDG